MDTAWPALLDRLSGIGLELDALGTPHPTDSCRVTARASHGTDCKKKKKISYNVCTSIQLLKDLHSQPVLRHEKREDQLDRWHDVGGMSVQYSTC